MRTATLPPGFGPDDVPAFDAALRHVDAIDVDLRDACDTSVALLASLQPCGATRAAFRNVGGAGPAVAAILRGMRAIDAVELDGYPAGLDEETRMVLARRKPRALTLGPAVSTLPDGLVAGACLRRLVVQFPFEVGAPFFRGLPATLEELDLRSSCIFSVGAPGSIRAPIRRLRLTGCRPGGKRSYIIGERKEDTRLDLRALPHLAELNIEDSLFCFCQYHLVLGSDLTSLHAERCKPCGDDCFFATPSLRTLCLGGGGVSARWPPALVFSNTTGLHSLKLHRAYMRDPLLHAALEGVAAMGTLRTLDLTGSRVGKNVLTLGRVLGQCPVEKLVLRDADVSLDELAFIGWTCPTLRVLDLSNAKAMDWQHVVREFGRRATNVETFIHNHAKESVFPDLPWAGLRDVWFGAAPMPHFYALQLADTPCLRLHSSGTIPKNGPATCRVCESSTWYPTSVNVERFVRRRRAAVALLGVVDRCGALPPEMVLPVLTAAFGFRERCLLHGKAS